MQRGVVFLDRDGTLIDIEPYAHGSAQLTLLPGVVQQLQRLSRLDLALVIVSNQSGVGRGFISVDDVWAVHHRLERELRECDVNISAGYYCYHAPWDVCACRKPRPGLLNAAREELGLTAGLQFMVGDKTSDVLAGHAAGCTSYLVERFQDGGSSWRTIGDRIAEMLSNHE